MTAAEFDVILEQRIVEMRRVLGLKAGEYASSNDRLHNFKRSAQEFGDATGRTTSASALLGMLRKHWTSIADLVDKHDNRVPVSSALIDEKIGDAVNYLVLLEAILKE